MGQTAQDLIFFSTLGKDDGSGFRERSARSGTDCLNMLYNPLWDEDIDPLRELRRIQFKSIDIASVIRHRE